MNRPVTDSDHVAQTRRFRSRNATWGAASVVVALVITVGVLLLLDFNRDVPKFPLLTDRPDATLRGTVAYVTADNCIHLADLSGIGEKNLWCMPKWDPDEAALLGKPMPPQLVWLPNSRLEVTIFRMTNGPGVKKGWQKIIDVKTGVVTDTPDAQVPSNPNLSTRPTTSPSGDVVSFTSNDETGHITISVKSASGMKSTLLDVRGPNHYAYRLNAAFWAPDFKSIIADDGRILVVTPTSPPLTRILTTTGGGDPFGEINPAHAGFAITSEKLVST